MNPLPGDMVDAGNLSVGHSRVLTLGLDDIGVTLLFDTWGF